jgi:hypothetical protein
MSNECLSKDYSLLITDSLCRRFGRHPDIYRRDSSFCYLRLMKWIGILAALALIIACFFPWVFVESKNITVTGIESAGTNFGKPGYFHFFLAAMYLLFTFIPRVWAKRWNLLIVALNISWAARNYFLISACSGGECPEKKAGLYIVLISSLLMLLAALFPKMEVSSRSN